MIQDPTRDAETFTRQFARIKARDAERASRIQNGSKLAEMDASRAEMSFEEWTELMVSTLIDAYRLDPVEDAEAFFGDDVPQEDIDKWKAAIRGRRKP